MSTKPPPKGRPAPPPKRKAPSQARDSAPSLPRSKTSGHAPPKKKVAPPRGRGPPVSLPKREVGSPEHKATKSPALTPKEEFAAALNRALSHSATSEATGPSLSPTPPGTTILRPHAHHGFDDDIELDDEETLDGVTPALTDSSSAGAKRASTFRGIFGGGSGGGSSKRATLGPSGAARSKTDRRGYSSMKLPRSLLGALHSTHSAGSSTERQDSTMSEVSVDSLLSSPAGGHSFGHASKASTLSISVFRDTTLDAIKHSDYYYETSQIVEWFDESTGRWTQGFVKGTSEKGRFVSVEIGRDGVGGFQSLRVDLANEAYVIRHADSLPSVRTLSEEERKERDLVDFVRRRFRISPPPKIETNQSKLTRMKRLLKREVPPLPIFGIPLSKITECEHFSEAYECPIPTCLIFLTGKMDELFSWNLPSLFDAMVSAEDPSAEEKTASKTGVPKTDTMERTKSEADKKKAILDESGARVLGTGTGVGIYENMKVRKKPKVFKTDIDELIFIIENSEEKTYKMEALFSAEYCGYLLAECVKIFFRKLGNPLLNGLVNAGIGSSKWDHFREPKKKMAEKLGLISKLEKSVLYFLTDGVFLKLLENEDENEMTVERIARIWMPILLFGEIATELPGDESVHRLIIDWFSVFVKARETSLQWAS